MAQINSSIEIVSGIFSTTSTSYGPTGHDMGLFEWDDSKYDNVIAVYFEAILRMDFAGAPDGGGTVYAILYNKTNSVNISASEISIGGSVNPGSYKVAISADIKADMPSGAVKDIGVRIKVGGASQTGHCSRARLTVIQQTPFTKTRIFIPVGYNNSNVGTTFTEKESKRFLADVVRWDGTISANFHASLKASIGTTGYAELYDTIGAVQVVQVSVVGGTIFSLLKGTFSWPTVDKEYTTRIKNNNAGGTTYIANAFVVLDITDSPKKFELHSLIWHYERADSTGVPVNESGGFLTWRATQYSDLNAIFYFEAVLKSNNSSVMARIQLRDDGVIVSILETNSTIYDRVPSDQLLEFSDLSDLRGYEYTSQIGVNIWASSARIIVVVSGFLISSSHSLPIQVRKKIDSNHSLSIQISKKIAATHSLPVMLQETVPPSVVFAQSTLTLKPSGVGTNTALTPVGAAANWDCTDDPAGPDDDATYVRGGYGGTDLYDMENSGLAPATVIDKIEVVARFKAPQAGNRAQIVIRDPNLGGTQYSMRTLTSSYVNYTEIYTVNPYTGIAWTVAQIDALNIGCAMVDGEPSAPQQTRMTQIYCIVYYQSGSPTVEPQFQIPIQIRKKITAQYSLPIHLRKKDVESQHSLPIQITKKVEVQFSLPVQVRKRIETLYSLPIQILSPQIEIIYSLPIQIRQKVSSQFSLPVQLRTNLSGEANLPIQIRRKISQTISWPIQIRRKIEAVYSLPIQIQSLSLAIEYSLPIQIRRKISSVHSLPLQIMESFEKTESLPIQIRRKITVQASLPIQLRKKIEDVYSLPIEIVKHFEAQYSIPIQIRQRIGQIYSLPVEFRKKIEIQYSFPVMIGTLVFSLNIINPQLLLTVAIPRLSSAQMTFGYLENIKLQIPRLDGVNLAS